MPEIPPAQTTPNGAPGSDRPPGEVRRPQVPFWTPWATVGWTLVVAAVFVVVQIGVMIAWLAASSLERGELELHPVSSAVVSGDLFAVATLATAAVCIPLVWLLTAIKARGRTARALALRRVDGRALAVWLGTTAVLVAASDLLTVALGRPLVPAFMTDLVGATAAPALLWPAIVVAAPVFEEVLVRGFLLEGLRRGSLGSLGAVVVTAFAWAAVHFQYDAYEVATIAVFGLFLGAARVRSGSLWVAVAMHVLVNLAATVETLIVLAH